MIFKNLDLNLKKLNPNHLLIVQGLDKSRANSIYEHYNNGKNGNGKYEVAIRTDEDDSKKYEVSFKLKKNGVNKNA